MSELYELPDGWEWKCIDDTIQKTKNRTPKNEPTKEFTYIDISSIDNSIFSIKSPKRLKSSDAPSRAKKEVFLNDIIFATTRPNLKNIAIIKEEYDNPIASTGFCVLRVNDKIEYQYLFFYLISNIFYKQVEKSIRGAQYPAISDKDVKSISIPIPPLKEQKRIVAKLDALFAKIDQAITLLQQNIDEADKFMGSILNEVFGELEEKYELEKIGNMIDVLTDYHSNGAYKTLKANVELLDHKNYALMIRATDLENENYISNVKYITENAYNFMSKSKVYGGEIILPKIGSIGNVYFMPYLNKPISLAMNLFMLRCSDNVMNRFLFVFLKSPKGYESILNRANGAVTKTITKEAVKSIKLPLPPLKIQQKTVTYLDQLSQKTEVLKQVQKEKLENLKALKASILDRAFRGEL